MPLGFEEFYTIITIFSRITFSQLQIPNPKIVLFGTFLKIGPKIRKISRFQINTEIALVDGFYRNLCQMEGLGLYFSEKLKFQIFRQFYYVI